MEMSYRNSCVCYGTFGIDPLLGTYACMHFDLFPGKTRFIYVRGFLRCAYRYIEVDRVRIWGCYASWTASGPGRSGQPSNATIYPAIYDLEWAAALTSQTGIEFMEWGALKGDLKFRHGAWPLRVGGEYEMFMKSHGFRIIKRQEWAATGARTAVCAMIPIPEGE